MSQEQNRAEETEIEPLSDEALEEVSGGVCSDTDCSKTIIIKPAEPTP